MSGRKAPGRPRRSPLPVVSRQLTGSTQEGKSSSEGGLKTGRYAAMLRNAETETLTTTFLSEAGPPAGTDTVVVRLKGRRADVKRRPQPGDQFVRELIIEDLPPAGRFSITTQVSDVNSGEWLVKAEMLHRTGKASVGSGRDRANKPVPLRQASWSWRRWALSEAREAPVSTGVGAFAQRPAIIIGVWPALALVGTALAFALLAVISARVGMSVGPTLTVSMLAVVSGAIGAKAWYVVLKRNNRSWNGWCIQGFILALIVVTLAVVPQTSLSPGRFLDVITPPLFLGMAVGRIGCFFAGCCCGRPTSARWGICSSDRRVLTRRVPTQLMEAGLALTISLVTLLLLVKRAPNISDMVFVSALAAYTLVRQWLLQFRAERRRTSLGSGVIAAAAAMTLGGAIAMMVAG
jgi:phosphatidylglycerol:prolipoprotein diacylglycerol transferase